jgi:glucosamine--fructose-6-phosphate aminotransferase (isomerizing)
MNDPESPELPAVESTFLYREIHEQPDVLQTFLDREQRSVAALAADLRRRTIRYVLIAARGTSDNAGRYAKYLLGSVNRLPVALATPSLYTIYQQPPRMDNALVLGISQSGKSPDIVSVLAEAQRQGALTAAITNFADSDLARQAQHVIQLHAGVEHSVAATKTYTAELLAVALLGSLLTENNEMLRALHAVPTTVAAALALNENAGEQAHQLASARPAVVDGPVSHIVQRYRYMRDCVVIGRGYNYASAFELALKLKELTYIIAEPYSSADFLHGPLALVEQGFPVLVFAPGGVMLAEIRTFMETLRQHRAEIIALSNDPQTLALADVRLPLPDQLPEWLSPIPAIVPGQLFALHLAHIRGYHPDQPRSLHKVTETR